MRVESDTPFRFLRHGFAISKGTPLSSPETPTIPLSSDTPRCTAWPRCIIGSNRARMR